MACGYEMARWGFRTICRREGTVGAPAKVEWPFEAIRREITSPEEPDQRRRTLLETLAVGAKVKM